MRELRRHRVNHEGGAGRWSWFADGWVRRTLGLERARDDGPQSLSERVSRVMEPYGDFDGWHDAALRALKDEDIRSWLADQVDWTAADQDNDSDDLFDRTAGLDQGDNQP